jgi:hypothetical protein
VLGAATSNSNSVQLARRQSASALTDMIASNAVNLVFCTGNDCYVLTLHNSTAVDSERDDSNAATFMRSNTTSVGSPRAAGRANTYTTDTHNSRNSTSSSSNNKRNTGAAPSDDSTDFQWGDL